MPNPYNHPPPSGVLTASDIIEAKNRLSSRASFSGLRVMVVPTWEYTKPRHHRKKRMRKKIAKYHIPRPVEPKGVLVLGGETLICTARQKALIEAVLSEWGA